MGFPLGPRRRRPLFGTDLFPAPPPLDQTGHLGQTRGAGGPAASPSSLIPRALLSLQSSLNGAPKRGVSCMVALGPPFCLPLHPTFPLPLCPPGPPLQPHHCPGGLSHLHPALPLPAVGAAEVVRVVGVILEHEGLLVDDQVAALTDVLAQALGLLAVVTGSAQVSVGSEAGVRNTDSPPQHPQAAGPPPWRRHPRTPKTKVRLVKVVVFPVVRYGCESWTIKKAEHQRIDAFKPWCWRRLLRVPWTARRSNQSTLRKIQYIGRADADAEAEAPILWPPDAKS